MLDFRPRMQFFGIVPKFGDILYEFSIKRLYILR